MTDDDTHRHHIPAAAVDRIVKIADRIELEAGEVFIREGDFDESIYLIETGQVEVERGGMTVWTIVSNCHRRSCVRFWGPSRFAFQPREYNLVASRSLLIS